MKEDVDEGVSRSDGRWMVGDANSGKWKTQNGRAQAGESREWRVMKGKNKKRSHEKGEYMMAGYRERSSYCYVPGGFDPGETDPSEVGAGQVTARSHRRRCSRSCRVRSASPAGCLDDCGRAADSRGLSNRPK